MIFITLGSQKFQFNRLLIEIDRLIEEGKIIEEVYAQIGYSDYIPKNYRYTKFLDRKEFSKVMNRCDKVITHGGTGAIIGSIKEGKKVIAIPRLKEYNEHVDDHQLQIVRQFDSMGFIIGIYNTSNIEEELSKIDNYIFKTYVSNTYRIINSIESWIDSN